MPNRQFDLLTLQQAMDILGVSRATIDRWRKDKQLPHVKIGKEIFVEEKKLHSWMQTFSQGRAEMPAKEAEAPSSSPRLVTIGYQSGAALLWSPLIIRKLGLFEEQLQRLCPGENVRIEWVHAPNGIELVEELIAGRVRIASVGDFPIMMSMALSRVLTKFKPVLLAFDGKTPVGEGISLVVPSSRSSRKPLSAASIATVGHSSASFRLDEWTNALDLRTPPIIHRGMSDCLDGIVGGSLDASVLWEPYLSWAKMAGAGVTVSGEGTGNDYLTGLLADDRWAQDNEAVTVAYLAAHLQAHQFIRNSPDMAARLIHGATGYPVEVVAKAISKIRWDASLYNRDLQTLESLDKEDPVRFPGSQPKAGVTRHLPIRKPYLHYAIDALKLPALPDAPLPGDWSEQPIY